MAEIAKATRKAFADYFKKKKIEVSSEASMRSEAWKAWADYYKVAINPVNPYAFITGYVEALKKHQP